VWTLGAVPAVIPTTICPQPRTSSNAAAAGSFAMSDEVPFYAPNRPPPGPRLPNAGEEIWRLRLEA
jgi:hypothetical protein